MSRKALRYRTAADMPEGMRNLMAMKPVTGPKPNKYGAIATVVDGIRFDSKREARYYEQLKARKERGEVAYWLRQVPLHLPGGTKLVIDFLVFYPDGRAEYIDVKGKETPVFRIKRREVEHHYPLKVVLA